MDSFGYSAAPARPYCCTKPWFSDDGGCDGCDEDDEEVEMPGSPPGFRLFEFWLDNEVFEYGG